MDRETTTAADDSGLTVMFCGEADVKLVLPMTNGCIAGSGKLIGYFPASIAGVRLPPAKSRAVAAIPDAVAMST